MCSLGRYSDPGVGVCTAVNSGGKQTTVANLFWRPMIRRISYPTTKKAVRAQLGAPISIPAGRPGSSEVTM